MCADTKPVLSWMVGHRSQADRYVFMQDVAARLSKRVRLSPDAYKGYPAAVEKAFGSGMAATTPRFPRRFKKEGRTQQGRHSPSAVVAKVEVTEVVGTSKRKHISTSYVERSNLEMRTNIRRFTRLTNAVSKKAENHAHSVALYFMAHNSSARSRDADEKTNGYKTTPAMACGITKHV